MKKALFAVATALVTTNAIANECGILSSSGAQSVGKESVYIVSHNGKPLREIVRRQDRVNKPYESGWTKFSYDGEGMDYQISYSKGKFEQRLFLEPGLHTFEGYAVCSERTSAGEDKACRDAFFTPENEVSFNFKVDRNKEYIVSAAGMILEGSGRRPEVEVISKKAEACGEERTAKALTSREIIRFVNIPPQLQFELDSVMRNIADFYSKLDVDDQIVKLQSQSKVDKRIGILFEMTNVDPERGMKILAVTPQSTASELGLMSGDWVKRVNDTYLTSATKNHLGQPVALKMFREELLEAQYGEMLTFEVYRNNQRKELINIYKPVRFPGYQIEIDLTNK